MRGQPALAAKCFEEERQAPCNLSHVLVPRDRESHEAHGLSEANRKQMQ